MKRPEIKDKKAREYVQYLEQQLDNFKPDRTNVRLYLGMKRQLDDMAELLNKEHVEITIPDTGVKIKTKLISVDTLQSKDDKFMDRYQKMLDKFLTYMKDLEAAEKIINPEILSQEEKEAQRESGSVYEKAMNG